ncbi:MAG: phosphate ABC transporter substrate-binding protein [Ruminiclostridium sp.]
MKKIITSMAAMGLLIGSIAGCGATAETTTQGTTTAAPQTTTAANDTATAELTGTLAINGSTSMEKVAKALNGAFCEKYPGVTITLDLTGSGTGIQEAMEGKIDIGNSSRALKAEETGLVTTTIGIDGIAIVVNNENKVTDLTLEQLEKIYSGEIKNWSEVGGDDKAIVVIGREDGSGTRDGFESIVMKNSTPAYAQELESTGTVISTVSTTAGAIGYASLANVDDSVKALSIDGVAPSEATVKDGTFPIQRPFICVYKEGNDSELVKAYLEFALSDAGQEQVVKAGAVSVK